MRPLASGTPCSGPATKQIGTERTSTFARGARIPRRHDNRSYPVNSGREHPNWGTKGPGDLADSNDLA